MVMRESCSNDQKCKYIDGHFLGYEFVICRVLSQFVVAREGPVGVGYCEYMRERLLMLVF
jgi:hypothetical protein